MARLALIENLLTPFSSPAAWAKAVIIRAIPTLPINPLFKIISALLTLRPIPNPREASHRKKNSCCDLQRLERYQFST
jgi:hypothetical protein